MKISVSLAQDELAALDQFVAEAGLSSRSAGIQMAIRRLPDGDLESDYAAAWEEWEATGEAEAWDSTSLDGLADASR